MTSSALKLIPRALIPVVGVLLVAFLVPCQAQESPPTRLILKDGSYQLITKYEVKGDRVRYYSVEREEWEELPNSLVDWPATEQYEKDRPSAAPEAVQLDKEIENERAAEEAKLPEVSPGLRLPEDSGVFLLDNFKGEAQLVEVQQSAGDVSQNSKASIFRGAISPIAGLKQTIQLDGAHATVQAHVEVPSLYINVDAAPEQPDQSGLIVDSTRPAQKPQQAQQPQQPQQPSVPLDRYRLIRTEVRGDKRIIGDVKRQVTGKVSEEQHLIKTTITRVGGGWLKLTPIESLKPGEYAIVEVVDKQVNLYVWDFGVNANAPGNANPWKPESKPASPAPAAAGPS
jgi:hypothetical protein